MSASGTACFGERFGSDAADEEAGIGIRSNFNKNKDIF